MPNTEPLRVPLPDLLGLLEAEATALGSPVVPVDPLSALCKRWLGRFFESREKAIQNYAQALQGQPLSPEARERAIRNYQMALLALPKRTW